MSCRGCDIFEWKNPVHTGVVLGTFNVAVLAPCLLDISVVSLSCYAVMALMCVGFLAKTTMGMQAESFQIPSELTREVGQIIATKLEMALVFARDVVMWKDMMFTFQF